MKKYLSCNFHIDIIDAKTKLLIQELQTRLALNFNFIPTQQREAMLRTFIEHFKKIYVKHYGV